MSHFVRYIRQLFAIIFSYIRVHYGFCDTRRHDYSLLVRNKSSSSGCCWQWRPLKIAYCVDEPHSRTWCRSLTNSPTLKCRQRIPENLFFFSLSKHRPEGRIVLLVPADALCIDYIHCVIDECEATINVAQQS